MSLETAIRKALERVGPGADPEQRARVYQSARLALENGLRQQNITDPATASGQRRQLEAAINRVERDAKLDYMEHESRQRAAREEAEREERRLREIERAEQNRVQAEQAREQAERTKEQAERDAELRRRRDEIDRERIARELEYEAAQRALRDRIAAREQAARERALQEREQMLATERQEEEARRQAEDARREAQGQAEREAEARRRGLEEQAEREEAIRQQAERERLAREQAARESAERQAAEREREVQERERRVREEAERRAAEETARRAAEAERVRLDEVQAVEEARRREAAAASAAIGGMVRHEDAPQRDNAPSLDEAPAVELARSGGQRDEPVFDIMPEVEHREERRAPSFDVETPEPAYATAHDEPEPRPEVIHLPPERAVKPRRKSRWKARAFALVTLAAFGAAGWWWVESTGLTLPKAVRDGSVPNPPPSVKEEDFDGAKQLKSLSRQGGYGDEWTKLYEAGKTNTASAGPQATAKVEQSGSGPYLAITSNAAGLDGSVSIDLPQNVIASMQGKTSNIALMLEGGDKPVQVTVECEFGGLGNCGRHRFLLSQNKNDLMFDVQVKSGGAADGPGRLIINADAGGEGNSAKLFSIHVLPGS